MNIDISRLNLLEKDIEDWLYENPGAIRAKYDGGPITKWIGRQYQLPSGVADLIGIRESNMLIVVEVKNVPINKAAILQVCRYQDDLKHIIDNRMNYPHRQDWHEPQIEMILVGPSIDGQTFTEARAVGVQVFEFSVSLDIDVNPLNWTKAHHEAVEDQRSAISTRPEWDIFGLTISQDIEQHRLEQETAANKREDFTVEESDGLIIIRGAHNGEGYSDIILNGESNEDTEDS